MRQRPEGLNPTTLLAEVAPGFAPPPRPAVQMAASSLFVGAQERQSRSRHPLAASEGQGRAPCAPVRAVDCLWN